MKILFFPKCPIRPGTDSACMFDRKLGITAFRSFLSISSKILWSVFHSSISLEWPQTCLSVTRKSKHYLNDISSDKKRYICACRVHDNLQMCIWGWGDGFFIFIFKLVLWFHTAGFHLTHAHASLEANSLKQFPPHESKHTSKRPG